MAEVSENLILEKIYLLITIMLAALAILTVLILICCIM